VLHLNGLRVRRVCKTVTDLAGSILKELEGPLGGRAWFVGTFLSDEGRDLRSQKAMAGRRADRADLAKPL
jgi:hypothetical protein